MTIDDIQWIFSGIAAIFGVTGGFHFRERKIIAIPSLILMAFFIWLSLNSQTEMLRSLGIGN